MPTKCLKSRSVHPYLTALMITVATFVGCFTHAQSNESLERQDPVNVAIVGPMAGTSFAVGMQFKAGVHAAINNMAEGSLLGRHIRITEYDDRCAEAVAESLSRDLVKSPPDIVIGHSCSATTQVSAPIYAASNILQISPASTGSGITEMGITTIFRMIGRDDEQGLI
ncbi:ABC transporter substrate-binding protein [Pseudohongiella spirulinae]|uniref:ABC-type transporter, substrate-binding protein n=1 Tax=Pseudohongiella spirulinae TaxID=1249552 RepID=A0A0S2KHE1_9GAMM|nr:ABC transporter substrate-binding protein [Pseudohongiella spirulinae]ALO47539.1 ABC-type transporter, substrate-binding protein [Pseudohongiella spirulinae]